MPLPRFRIGFFALFALIFAVFHADVVRAETDVYTIERVAVDVTADSAAAARERALARGHEAAFRRLIDRLVPEERASSVSVPSYDSIANMVRDFEVFDERTSSVRYLAELRIRFQPQAVRRFLRGRGVTFAETQSKPVVVLALYGAAGDAVLWEEPNPWRAAWAAAAPSTGLVPFVIPFGDLADIRAISAAEALDNDGAALDRIEERHGAGDVLVTQAIPAGDAQAGQASAQIITSRIGTAAQERTFVDNVRQREGESLEDMLGRAVAKVAREVEEAWKRANLLRFEAEQGMSVEVPIAGLDEWVSVRRRLESIPLIGAASLRLMTRDLAEVDLTYYGDTEQLRLALAQSDLTLKEGGASGWTLTAAGSAASSAPVSGNGGEVDGGDPETAIERGPEAAGESEGADSEEDRMQ
ncbi:DUF2066 domain-containing protein [Ferruginivarius sediminum]|uniref:DUF2066 domain-containing protein n=1 Tax=Ferruginivarius sediminum TaxID=2661937 RepID=A0A369TBW1_9PROT|nr:DUF2066 domain-containing protein [Ferruginivarius sediminum]RDD62799.1 DUF2066 domain-containing protein [Ferruginivarius sediminum]